MPNEHFYAKRSERREKEFIYDQWRKYLALIVVDSDICITERAPIEVTNEELRAIFTYGYKFAMMQMLQQLNKKSRSHPTDAEKLIDDLFAEVKDRMVTSDCLETYQRRDDEDYIRNALKRKADFDYIDNKDFCSW
jgi:hypothetical protein